MTWERTSHKLACGCEVALPWDDVDAGDVDEDEDPYPPPYADTDQVTY